MSIDFAVGFALRRLALFHGWEEPMPAGPNGVVMHGDSVLLGRKLRGKSQRELTDLGLVAEPESECELKPAVKPEVVSAGRRS